MDLSSMLNDGPPDEKPRSSAPQTSPSIGGPPRGSYPSSAPPPSQAQGQGQGRNLTPLHTPTNGQYPFPPSPSPLNTAGGQQAYRPYESYSATTPGGRPPSHGIFPPQPSPSHYGPGVQTHPMTSMSPTPSSHHSHTPHSMRQSPLTTTNHLSQQQSLPPHFHQSQPSTPLGPPPVVQRHSNQFDMASPYQQRNPSNGSNGMIAHSPAQHYPSIGNLVESPNAHRPHSQRRRTSDYSRSVDRERSVSVSPKTKVPARPPSLGSRHSSQQESYSARSSIQPSAGAAPSSSTPGHVTAPSSNFAQPPYAHSDGGVTQAYSHAPGSLSANAGNAGAGGSLSASNNQPQHHQSQKMGMNHLLAPTPQHEQYQNSQSNNSNAQTPLARSNSSEQSKPGSYSSPATAPPSHEKSQLRVQSDLSVKSESLPTSASSMPSKSSQIQPPEPEQQAGEVTSQESSQIKTPLKRAAESEPATEPPPKRGRRKYTERPIWAHLSHQNPRSREEGVVPNGAQPSKFAAASARANGAPPQQTNGQRLSPPPSGNTQQSALDVAPWLQNPPLDYDLMRARKVLGSKWEKSIRWNVPISSMVKSLMDWLYGSFEANSDIGLDPREGAIEIEAKIGTLVDSNTGERMVLPVLNAVVLDPRTTDRYQFESQMFEAAHQRMNKYLNECLLTAKNQKGRASIDYKHIKETDSFRTLSKYGISLLPQCAQKRYRRELRLRTSVDTKTGQVTARIVKVKLAELQIHSPGESYDCRITMNLEVNLDRPDIDVHALVEEPTHEKPAQPDRVKDRLSYKHLAYSTDLTRVDTKGLSPKYELELEVDANTLRHQKQLLQNGQENGYQAVVEGFIENLTLLMRQPKM